MTLGAPAAKFREPRVADHSVVTEKLAVGGTNGLDSRRREDFRDALITLAVIVSAHIEIGMRFASVPAKDFVGAEIPLLAGEGWMRRAKRRRRRRGRIGRNVVAELTTPGNLL